MSPVLLEDTLPGATPLRRHVTTPALFGAPCTSTFSL
jgi:hypothetical protein